MKFLKDVTFFIRNGASIKQRKGCSGIPITRIETISNGRFNYDHLGYADIFDSDTYKKYYLKDNDVLFSHINSEKFLGRTVLYHPKNKTENIIHGMNLLCLRFNQSEYSPEFFYWYSKSSTAKEFYRINTKHAVNQASIPSSAIKEMPIPDFTLNKQYTIVHSLNQIQSSIDYKLDQITKLDSLVKSRFMEMFGDPIINSKQLPTKKVIDVVTLQRGYDLPIQARRKGDVPIYGSNGFIDNHDVFKAESGVITGRSGTLGKVYASETPFWPLNTTLFSIDCHNNNVIYLKWLLTFFHLERFGSGSGVPTLNRNIFHGEQIMARKHVLIVTTCSVISSVVEEIFLVSNI